MPILPPLPYAYDSLEPTIGAETLHLHHDKHHAGYVKKTEALAGEAGLRDKPLEAIVREAARSGPKTLFNNAAQAWNHGFYWQSMTPAFEPPRGDLAQAIAAAFGDLDGLKTQLVETGAGHFGSGWVWLVWTGEALKVIATHDAANPLTDDDSTPLIGCDLWEHAYYLDHQNDREAYLEAWFDTVANWAFAEAQFKAAKGDGRPWTYPAA